MPEIPICHFALMMSDLYAFAHYFPTMTRKEMLDMYNIISSDCVKSNNQSIIHDPNYNESKGSSIINGPYMINQVWDHLFKMNLKDYVEQCLTMETNDLERIKNSRSTTMFDFMRARYERFLVSLNAMLKELIGMNSCELRHKLIYVGLYACDYDKCDNERKVMTNTLTLVEDKIKWHMH